MNATTVSVFRMAGDIGYIGGPIILGVVSDVFGPIAALIGAAALLVVAGLMFATFAPETYRTKAT